MPLKKVNLGINSSVCLNLTLHNETQLKTQKLVAGVQVFDAFLEVRFQFGRFNGEIHNQTGCY